MLLHLRHLTVDSIGHTLCGAFFVAKGNAGVRNVKAEDSKDHHAKVEKEVSKNLTSEVLTEKRKKKKKKAAWLTAEGRN